MIALPNELPLIEWTEGRYIPLSEGWIAESIESSINPAVDCGPVPLDAVLYSLIYFLKDRPHGTRLSRDELARLVQKALEALGYAALASGFQLVSPRVTIHLPELASQSTIELAFFDALQVKLDEAVGCLVRGIRLEGIRDSVKRLHNARRWRKDCQQLNDEIVSFSRRTIQKTGQPVIDLVIS